MVELNGPFKEIIPMFQKYKKSIGYKYDNINDYIMLDKKLSNEKIYNLNDTSKIFELLVTNESSDKRKEKNYKCLLQLYEFMKVLGYTDLYFETTFFKGRNSKKTTIFTKKEIITFFNDVDEYSKKENNNIYPVIFRLIYSCGLRISEAINIKLFDLSLEKQAITVVKSKNNITRIVPLSDSMFEVIKKYLNTEKNKNREYLFEINGKKMNKENLEKVMKEINKSSNVRVHDLRHTFAVHTLDRLFSDGIKSSEAIYPLTIYMGHSSIKSTEYYLQFTKEYYKEVVKKVDKSYPNIFPKVGEIDE